VLLHHPLRPRGEPTNLWNDLELVSVLSEYPCVLATLNGHAHKFLYDFHHTVVRDIHFITFGGMVQSPFTSWGFVDVYEDVLHVHGLVFGRAIDLKYNIAASRVPSTLPPAPAVTAEDGIAFSGQTVEVASVAPTAAATGFGRLTTHPERRDVEEALELLVGGQLTQGVLLLVLVVGLLSVALRRSIVRRLCRRR
jgi:hypothetical protein